MTHVNATTSQTNSAVPPAPLDKPANLKIPALNPASLIVVHPLAANRIMKTVVAHGGRKYEALYIPSGNEFSEDTYQAFCQQLLTNILNKIPAGNKPSAQPIIVQKDSQGTYKAQVLELTGSVSQEMDLTAADLPKRDDYTKNGKYILDEGLLFTSSDYEKLSQSYPWAKTILHSLSPLSTQSKKTTVTDRENSSLHSTSSQSRKSSLEDDLPKPLPEKTESQKVAPSLEKTNEAGSDPVIAKEEAEKPSEIVFEPQPPSLDSPSVVEDPKKCAESPVPEKKEQKWSSLLKTLRCAFSCFNPKASLNQNKEEPIHEDLDKTTQLRSTETEREHWRDIIEEVNLKIEEELREEGITKDNTKNYWEIKRIKAESHIEKIKKEYGTIIREYISYLTSKGISETKGKNDFSDHTTNIERNLNLAISCLFRNPNLTGIDNRTKNLLNLILLKNKLLKETKDQLRENEDKEKNTQEKLKKLSSDLNEIIELYDFKYETYEHVINRMKLTSKTVCKKFDIELVDLNSIYEKIYAEPEFEKLGSDEEWINKKIDHFKKNKEQSPQFIEKKYLHLLQKLIIEQDETASIKALEIVVSNEDLYPNFNDNLIIQTIENNSFDEKSKILKDFIDKLKSNKRKNEAKEEHKIVQLLLIRSLLESRKNDSSIKIFIELVKQNYPGINKNPANDELLFNTLLELQDRLTKTENPLFRRSLQHLMNVIIYDSKIEKSFNKDISYKIRIFINLEKNYQIVKEKLGENTALKFYKQAEKAVFEHIFTQYDKSYKLHEKDPIFYKLFPRVVKEISSDTDKENEKKKAQKLMEEIAEGLGITLVSQEDQDKQKREKEIQDKIQGIHNQMEICNKIRVKEKLIPRIEMIRKNLKDILKSEKDDLDSLKAAFSHLSADTAYYKNIKDILKWLEQKSPKPIEAEPISPAPAASREPLRQETISDIPSDAVKRRHSLDSGQLAPRVRKFSI